MVPCTENSFLLNESLMGEVGHADASRRGFLKGSLLASGAAIIAPSGLLFPSPANAQYVETALAVVSFVSAMRARRGGGMGQRMAALNIKLDQVLDNQITILGAVGQLQSSIQRLSEDVEGYLINADYRSFLRETLAVTELCKRLIARDAPPELKAKDFEGVFNDLYRLVLSSKAALQLGPATRQGLTSALYASSALMVLTENCYSLAQLEIELPEDLRWQSSRPQKYEEMMEVLEEALTLLKDRRLVEADGEQIRRGMDNWNDFDETPWGHYIKIMFGKIWHEEQRLKTAKGEDFIMKSGSLQIGINFISTIYETRQQGFVIENFIQSRHTHLSFEFKRIDNIESEFPITIFTDLSVPPAEDWVRWMWDYKSARPDVPPKPYRKEGVENRFKKKVPADFELPPVQQCFPNTPPRTNARKASIINDKSLENDFQSFSSVAARHARAAYFRGALVDLDAVCRDLLNETNQFRVALRAKVAQG